MGTPTGKALHSLPASWANLYSHLLPPWWGRIHRTQVYVAHEAFFCGSGYEVTPILSPVIIV
jgi:hypothetical protein